MYPDFFPERKKVREGKWGVPVIQVGTKLFLARSRFCPFGNSAQLIR